MSKKRMPCQRTIKLTAGSSPKRKEKPMEFLRARVDELMENVRPLCQVYSNEIFWERYIVTIKSSEVVAWSLDCLLCMRTDCPFLKREPDASLAKEKVKKCA